MTFTTALTLSDHAVDALTAADTARRRLAHTALEPEHILAGLLDVPEGNAALILRNLHVDQAELHRELDLFLRRAVPLPSGDTVSVEGQNLPLGITGRSVLDRASVLAGDGPVGTEHLLRAVQTLPSPAATLLRGLGVTPEEVDRRFVSEEDAGDGPVVDLVERARRGLLPPLVGRPALLRELTIRLLAGGGRPLLLVGDPGSGRTSLVLLLAKALADSALKTEDSALSEVREDGVQHALPSHILRPSEKALLNDPAQAIRTAAQAAANAVLSFQSSALVWVPDLHTYLGTAARPSDIEAGHVLREIILEGRVTVIGSTTPEGQRRSLAGDTALFEAVAVGETSTEETLAIVRTVAPQLVNAHGVAITDDAIVAAADLARRYGSFTGVALPGAALRILARACVEVRLAGRAGLGFAAGAGDRTVDEADVAVAVSALTGVTVTGVGEEEATRLAAMEEHLRRRVIGQDEALNALARAVRRARMGFKDPKRPVGSFLFLGGSGVGKTESARALAEFLYGDESQMIRLDMSEYADKHTVARMIGAPPGYVGYEEGGQLTEAVRRRPESLVLFDEVEKAHPDVLTILLQVLEDGRLTDGKGRTVDFRQTVIIMTSNVGTQLLHEAQQPPGVGMDFKPTLELTPALKDLLEQELRRYFRVEFLNRIDKIIYFRFLAPDDLARILDLMLAKAAGRARERGVTLEMTPAAKEWLLAQNHEPELGARPLRRIVQDYVEDALVERLLQGAVRSDQIIRVDAGPDGLTFSAQDPAGTAATTPQAQDSTL